MKDDLNLRWGKKIRSLHKLLNKKLSRAKPSSSVRKWILSYIDLLESKYYVKSNIDDLLWFSKNGLSKNDRIMDFGTGGGYIAYLTADLVKTIIAYEYKEKWKNQNYSNSTYFAAFTFAQKTISKIESKIQFKFYRDLPLKESNKSFDGIILYAVIEHIDPKIRNNILSELYRILKTNGRLYIAKLPRLYSYQEYIARKLKFNSHSDLYTKGKINKLLSRHHFKILKIERTGLFVNYNVEITKYLFPVFYILEKMLKYTPVDFLAHDYRLIAKKI